MGAQTARFERGAWAVSPLPPHVLFVPSIWEDKPKSQRGRHKTFRDFLTLRKQLSYFGSGSSGTEPGGSPRVPALRAPCRCWSLGFLPCSSR